MSHRKIDVDLYDDEAYLDLEQELIAAVVGPTTDENGESSGGAPTAAQLNKVQEDRERHLVTLREQVTTVASQVRSLLQKGDQTAAIESALSFVPNSAYATQELKDQHARTVLETLTSGKITSDSCASLVKRLDVLQRDILMKYLYRGMSAPETWNVALLLTWHEKLVEVAGLGSIVRCMTDRRTV